MAYTEFYCDNANGNNLNAGTGGTNDYTTAGGNWTNATRTFTVTDGTNASTFISAGDFCSVYVTAGATVATFVGRVSTVQNQVNGTVVFTTAFMGSNPSNGTGTMTLKHGGFWKGPNGSQWFPLDRAQVGTAINSNSDRVRINLKNNQSYSVTSAVTITGLNNTVVQGYTTNPNDGGKATIDGSTNVITILTDNSTYDVWGDLIISSSATSGSVNNFVVGGTNQTLFRIVSRGARVSGIATTALGNITLIETETYDCNKSNTTNRGGIDIFSNSASIMLLNCISHDNTGNANNGFTVNGTGAVLFSNCISFNNGLHGLFVIGGASIPGGAANISQYDGYNNGGDAIRIGSTTTNGVFYWIQNCNFIKNTGKGINNVASNGNFVQGYVYNCGYGAGTQANSGGDATLGALVEAGKITYANNVTPWAAPTTGNFSINLAAAQNVGRGHFEENDGTHTGTVGYPDIGAAQHYDRQKASTFGG